MDETIMISKGIDVIIPYKITTIDEIEKKAKFDAIIWEARKEDRRRIRSRRRYNNNLLVRIGKSIGLL
jgi:hypothetical protein